MPKKEHNKRVNRVKVSMGVPPPSYASEVLRSNKLVSDPATTLDYGCGYDADFYGWQKYDPYCFDVVSLLENRYSTVVCTNVLSAVSRKVRHEIVENIQGLLTDKGVGYLVVPRNVPKNGKLSGYARRPQSYVVLSFESIYSDEKIEIYKTTNQDIGKSFKDHTVEAVQQ